MADSTIKRVRISKMQQHIMLSVLAASIVFGVSLVFAIYFIKYINFNSEVIKAKDKAMSNYDSVIKNVGICLDKDKDGKFSDSELDNCKPNDIALEDLPQTTLRYSVMNNMANNTDLESVARGSLSGCYTSNGSKINFTKAYQNSQSDEARAYNLDMLKMCSALRVIPDSLPAQENVEALLSSLTYIMNMSHIKFESISPGGYALPSGLTGLSVLPVNITANDSIEATTTFLKNIESSIRMFDIDTAQLKWSGEDKLELLSSANAYYSSYTSAEEETETVYATKEAKKKARQEKKEEQ